MRAVQCTVVALVVAVAGCHSNGGRGSGGSGSAELRGRTGERDLTRPESEGRMSAVSPLERAPVEPQRPTGHRVVPEAARTASQAALVPYVLEPAATPLPETLSSSETPSPRASAMPKAVSVAALPSGASVGAVTQGIVLQRPGRPRLDEPHEFAGLAGAFEPDRGGGIRLGRGGSCGPTRGVLEGRPGTPRY